MDDNKLINFASSIRIISAVLRPLFNETLSQIRSSIGKILPV